jgi:hypothetical protein
MTKKVLYIGHFRESSGWSEAAKHLALSMDYAGIDLVVRSIKLDGTNSIHPRLQELENRSTQGCDVVIQHTLPHFYEYSGVFKKNIGYFVGEGLDFRRCGWGYKAGLLDEIWVPNRELASSLPLAKKVEVVHHAHSIASYLPRYENVVKGDTYKFYCIIDFVNRKNLKGLLQAFHCEFDKKENVSLTIKISKNGESEQDVVGSFSSINDSICNNLNKYKEQALYNDISLITYRMSEEEIHGLHQSCDCYISLSHGEAWNYPLSDAVFHGNEVIASNVGGHKEYVPLSSGILVNGSWEPAQGYDSIPNYQTCEDDWFVPSVNEARKAMRQKFNESQPTPGFQKLRMDKSKKNRDLVNQFSYSAVGNRIKELL